MLEIRVSTFYSNNILKGYYVYSQLRKSIEEMGLYVSEKKDDETQKKTFSVRKPKPQGEIKPKRTNKFHVAKPAPQGASLEIPEKTPTGPR